MEWYARLTSFLRNLFRGKAGEREIDAELNSYFEEQAERNSARGMPSAEALRQARVEAGGVQQVK